MDFLKKAKDRVEQTVSESFGSAAKTEYDEQFQAVLLKADDIKLQTEKLIVVFEPYIQPDAAARLLPGLMGDSNNQPEYIAIQLGQYANHVAKWQPTDSATTTTSALGAESLHSFQTALKSAQDTFQIIGQADRDYLNQVSNNFLAPIKHFLNNNVKDMEHEKKKLSTKRLDMDSAKNKAAKSSSANAEAERAVQAFNEQQQRVKDEVSKAENKLHEVQMALKKYVEAHIKYVQSVEAALSELHTKI